MYAQAFQVSEVSVPMSHGQPERRGDTMPPTTENKALVRRHFQAINDQDWAACADTLAENVVFHQGGEMHRGLDWFTNHWKGFYDSVPDASIFIDDLLAEDDRVAAGITNVGTNTGEIPGIESTGTELEFSSHLIARIDDDSITELWVVAEQPRPTSQ